VLLITLIAIVWVIIWILVLVDIVRRRDLTAGPKVLWALLVLILPVIGLIIYMVARPDQPGDRDLPSEVQGGEGFEPFRHGPA
jgi:Phospholipase_D-nuclease N-terminal